MHGAHIPPFSSTTTTSSSQVIKKLALETCKDVKIGSAMEKGISGGQAKRTNIGIALVTNPRVLFLDEPTSGLGEKERDPRGSHRARYNKSAREAQQQPHLCTRLTFFFLSFLFCLQTRTPPTRS